MSEMTYRTVSGDVWDMIAYKTLGSTDYMPVVMQANREHIGVGVFPAGIVLTIPEIDESTRVKNLPPWRRS